jgi:hypothetical protein
MAQNKKAIIVGNGVSRRGVDLAELNRYAIMFGCNAIYREYFPEFIVSLDKGMIKELYDSKYPEERLIIPTHDEQYEPAIFNPSRPRNNAGMIAMDHAIRRGYDYLVCLGMDFLIHDPDVNVDNMFEGTLNYGPETRASVNDTINRSKYFNWFVQQHPNVTFLFLFPESFQDRYLRLDALYKNLNVLPIALWSTILKPQAAPVAPIKKERKAKAAKH